MPRNVNSSQVDTAQDLRFSALPLSLCLVALVTLGLLPGCPSGEPSGVGEPDLGSGQDVSTPQDSRGALDDKAQADLLDSSDVAQFEDLVADADTTSTADLDETDTGPEVDPLDSFFSLESIHTIQIEVDAAGLASLVAEPKTYVRGAVQIDGTFYGEVGVRLKGSIGSFVAINETEAQGRRPGKSAFIIDFNKYVKGQDHLGLKKLTVNNMVQDSSGIHQFLGYSLFRELGVPASRSGFATVSFNGKNKGLYALVESPDDKGFLKRWFVSDKGNLYEGSGSDLTQDDYPAFDQDRGDDTSKEDLRLLSQALDAAPNSDEAYNVLASQLDLDEFLTFAATELYLAHWDGYSWNTNNYMILS